MCIWTPFTSNVVIHSTSQSLVYLRCSLFALALTVPWNSPSSLLQYYAYNFLQVITGFRFTSFKKISMNHIIPSEVFPLVYMSLIFLVYKCYSKDQLSKKHNLVVQKLYFNTKKLYINALFAMITCFPDKKISGFELSCEECKNCDLQMCEGLLCIIKGKYSCSFEL